ncbi:MAG: hypothetical protein FJY10_06625 [Bacteroidetes bacterium]|nr:hypothetical protein [Bacteroidota bacterium]
MAGKIKIQPIIKWTARVIGIASILFFGTFLVGEGIPEMKKEFTFDLLLPVIWLGLSVTFFVVAWFKPRMGGLLLTLWNLAMAGWLMHDSIANEWQAAMLITLPFIIPGILFMFCKK